MKPSPKLVSEPTKRRGLSRRAQMRRSSRVAQGITLVDIAKALPGKRWSARTDKNKRNRVSYLARIERHGTPCRKTALRLARFYDCSPYLFLPDGREQFEGETQLTGRRVSAR